MKVYTYSEARQKLKSVLERAKREGRVLIRRRDGTTFVITPEHISGSPLDVKGINADISADEIVSFVHEGRRIE